MLYFLYGDRIESRKNLAKHLDALEKKRPDAEVFRVKAENYSEDLILELVASQGLFSKKYIIVLDSLLEKKDTREGLLKFLDDFKSSEHVFLLIEEDIDKKTLDEVKKHVEKVWYFEIKEKKTFFNIFSLANFLGDKDRKNLWINFLKFINEGVSGEEISGILFWQMKNIMLAKKTKSAGESKLSPFADKNARNYARHWTESEILDFNSKLLKTNEMVRNGEGEINTFLEQVILGI